MMTPKQILHELAKPRSKYSEFDIKYDRLIDFAHDPEWKELIYSTPTPATIKQLNQWFKDNPATLVRLYHGTNADFDIETQGLLPTSMSRRNSYQSGSGYVYLSIYPSSAQMFGELAFPQREIVVYQVEIPVYMLVPDKDQLNNKRQYEPAMKDTLADSILYGHGARVKGKIAPYFIKRSR
jgi:hypothetical protein